MVGSLKIFLKGSGVLNSLEYSFYIDGPPTGPLLYCTQEQYSSLMNPPLGFIHHKMKMRACTWYLETNLAGHLEIAGALEK